MDGPGRLPDSEQLPLGANLRGAYEEEGARLLKALTNALACAGKSLDDVAADTGIDAAQLSRILNGRAANIPPRLLAYALWYDRSRILTRDLCALAGGEFKEKPAPSPAEILAKLKQALLDHDLWDVACAWAGLESREVQP